MTSNNCAGNYASWVYRSDLTLSNMLDEPETRFLDPLLASHHSQIKLALNRAGQRLDHDNDNDDVGPFILGRPVGQDIAVSRSGGFTNPQSRSMNNST